jgi:hypothetical protein
VANAPILIAASFHGNPSSGRECEPQNPGSHTSLSPLWQGAEPNSESGGLRSEQGVDDRVDDTEKAIDVD